MIHQDIIDTLCYAQKKYWQYTNADVGSTKILKRGLMIWTNAD